MIYLMYHELGLPGRATCFSEAGYVRYVVPADEFRNQVLLLRERGLRGLSVSGGLSDPAAAQAIVLTFDDGSETDLLTAAPILLDAGFGATFYVVAGFVNRPGYLSPGQLRDLHALGFDIGCHSMTHAFLTDVGERDLERETAGAKQRIEDMLGQPVHHFSCPGGRWNRHVSDAARKAGYVSVATSRYVENRANPDRFRLGRLAVQRSTPLPRFEALTRGRTLARQRARTSLLSLGKAVLGNSLYERLRAVMLGDR